MVTKEFYLSGVVQGVGMRYFIKRSARQFNLKGFVKNESDGRVHGIVQGTEGVINNWMDYIKKESPGHIESMMFDSVEEQKTYKRFTIKLW